MNRKLILASFVSLCIFVSALAQTQPPQRPVDDKDDVVKITTNLVQIDAVVTKDGKPVTDLTAEDFEIYEDGKRQAITSFAYISNISASVSSVAAKTAPDKTAPEPGLPPEPIKPEAARRTMAIVVDDLGMSAQGMNEARNRLRKLVAEELQPNDLVAVIRTGGQMGALQQFTNDKRVLNRAVSQLNWNPCSRIDISTITKVEDWRGGGCLNTHLGVSIKALQYILQSMGELPGRKSLVLVSEDISERVLTPGPEGADRILVTPDNVMNYGSWLRQITETAIRSSVVIYSIDMQGLQYTGIKASDAVSGRIPETRPVLTELLGPRFKTLQERREGSLRIAKETGGFQITNTNGLPIDRILEDQSGYYLIGYRPTDETFNRQFHHISAKVKRSGMTVRTRTGFFGVTEEDVARSRKRRLDQTNLALLSPFGAQGIELNVTSFFTHGKTEDGTTEGGKTEGPVVRSFVYVNANNLTFTPVNDRQRTSLEMHGVILGDNGSILEQVKHTAVLSLRENEYQQALRGGLNLRLDLPAKRPGSYQVRIAVRDQDSAKIGSAGKFVTVPDLKDQHLAVSGIVLSDNAGAVASGAAMANPSTRRFAAGSNLHFAFVIYNAANNPNLVMDTSLFRDGKRVSTEMQGAVSAAKQEDSGRLFATGMARLDRNLEPGNYYLQVVITDKAAKDKQPPVTQWVEFEIVK
jgi:VWFA-related protein